MRNLFEANCYKEKTGIYYIMLQSDKRVYIGSSVNIGRRIKQHYSELRTNTHKNSYLQNTWNRNEEKNFSFGVIEMCDKNNLLNREQKWIDFFKSANRTHGFNLSPVAGSTLGIKKTEQQIRNFQEAIQGKHNTNLTIEEASEVKNLINAGYSLTDIAELMNTSYENIRSIKRGSAFRYVDPQIDYEINMNAKLTESDVIEIKKKINRGIKVKYLANEYGVSHRTISAIKNEKNWKDVGEKITIKKRKSREKGESA